MSNFQYKSVNYLEVATHVIQSYSSEYNYSITNLKIPKEDIIRALFNHSTAIMNMELINKNFLPILNKESQVAADPLAVCLMNSVK